MTSKNHVRCAAMLTMATISIFTPPVRAAERTIFWGASGGFFYCGAYSPPESVLSHTTQFVAQLMWSPDAFIDLPQELSPTENDVVLDQVTVTLSNGAGSTWGDFVGGNYACPTSLTGYVYGRIVMTPFWVWYGYYVGEIVNLTNASTSPLNLPLIYNFNTNAAAGTEMGWNRCMTCIHPCPEPILAIDQSNDVTTVTYDAEFYYHNASYYLQVSHDPVADSWTTLGGSNLGGGSFAVTNQGDDALFRVMKKSIWY